MRDLTQEEIDAIERVVKKINGTKYLFGYNDIRDVKQEARIICIEVIRKDVFRGDSSLDTFLMRSVYNGLSILKRQTRLRTKSTCDCGTCKFCIRKNSKYCLYNHVGLDNIDEDWMVVEDSLNTEEFYCEEIMQQIDKKLPPELRQDYLKMIHDGDLSESRKKHLIEVIQDIIDSDF